MSSEGAVEVGAPKSSEKCEKRNRSSPKRRRMKRRKCAWRVLALVECCQETSYCFWFHFSCVSALSQPPLHFTSWMWLEFGDSSSYICAIEGLISIWGDAGLTPKLVSSANRGIWYLGRDRNPAGFAPLGLAFLRDPSRLTLAALLLLLLRL